MSIRLNDIKPYQWLLIAAIAFVLLAIMISCAQVDANKPATIAVQPDGDIVGVATTQPLGTATAGTVNIDIDGAAWATFVVGAFALVAVAVAIALPIILTHYYRRQSYVQRSQAGGTDD